jgi:hypothetical protein
MVVVKEEVQMSETSSESFFVEWENNNLNHLHHKVIDYYLYS